MKFEILTALAFGYIFPETVNDTEWIRLCVYFDKKYFRVIDFFE
jgi:hypothetical protein